MTECKNCLEEISGIDKNATKEYCGECSNIFNEEKNLRFKRNKESE